MDEQDDYDVFLDSWQPSNSLTYGTLEHYLSDPFSFHRVLDDTSASAPVLREQNAKGTKKEMSAGEISARGVSFFKDRQECWAAHFRNYVLSKDVPETKLDAYLEGVKNLWIDGRSTRQNSKEMLALKASIQAHDRSFYPVSTQQFVLNSVCDTVSPLFNCMEMKVIFEANSGLIDAFLPAYIDYLNFPALNSMDDIYLRRGVFLTARPTTRIEKNFMSSYSLALGPVEQFAQTGANHSNSTGQQTVISAPVGALHNRIVAFAGFIQGMDLSQLEFVVAPPTTKQQLDYHGEYGGIHEYSF